MEMCEPEEILMKKCPNCNHKLYEKEGGGFYCKNCPFVNDPNLKKKENEHKENNPRGKILISKSGAMSENHWMR